MTAQFEDSFYPIDENSNVESLSHDGVYKNRFAQTSVRLWALHLCSLCNIGATVRADFLLLLLE